MPRNPLVKSGVGDRPSRVGQAATVDVGATASTLDVRFGGSPEWSSWYRIPADVLLALEDAGLSPLEAHTAGAYEPRVRKRRDQFFERAKAWYVDYDAFAVIDAVRDLHRRPDGRFVRTSPWKLTVRRRPFVGDVRERSGMVPVDTGTSAGDQHPPEPTDVDVIDLLPTPVRRQVLGVVPEPEIDFDTLTEAAWRGKPAEHDAGLVRVARRQLIAVSATRKIEPKRMSAAEAANTLAVTAWEVRAVTATLDDERVTEVSVGAEREELESIRRAAALPALPPDQDAGD